MAAAFGTFMDKTRQPPVGSNPLEGKNFADFPAASASVATLAQHRRRFTMMEVNLPLVLLAAFVASASPGTATLAIAGTSMASGRSSGLPIASGITAGSLTWSMAAALGLGTIMLANVWLFEVIRCGGAAYLMYLTCKSARSALSRNDVPMKSMTGRSSTLFAKGPMLHITNPKAILFSGSLYSMAIPAGTPIWELVIVIAAVGIQSIVTFHG